MTATAIAAKVKEALTTQARTRAQLVDACDATPMQVDGAIRWLRKAGSIRRADSASGPGLPATYENVADYTKQGVTNVGVWRVAGLEERMLVLFGQGLSCTQIAHVLAVEHKIAITRNAVIGKLGRRGITRDKPSRPTAIARAARVVTFRPKPTTAPPVISAFPPRPALQLPIGSACEPKPLTALSPRMCKWAVNDGEDPRHGFLFCSAEVLEGPYCQRHAQIAYRPPPAVLSIVPSADARRFNGRNFAGSSTARFAE